MPRGIFEWNPISIERVHLKHGRRVDTTAWPRAKPPPQNCGRTFLLTASRPAHLALTDHAGKEKQAGGRGGGMARRLHSLSPQAASGEEKLSRMRRAGVAQGKYSKCPCNDEAHPRPSNRPLCLAASNRMGLREQERETEKEEGEDTTLSFPLRTCT